MKKRPTIQMVADRAGVSRGTVDRVLNNRAHVSPDVYARVMDALQETGYLPARQIHQNNLQARSSNLPVKLGVLLPNWSGHFRSEILRGIDKARREFEDLQVEILVEECKTDVPQEVLELIDSLLARSVQGFSLCVPNLPAICARVSRLLEENVPVVTFNSDLPDSGRLAFVGQDYHQSGRIAGELISKCIPPDGRILTAVGNLEFDGHKKRLEGFLERMRELEFCDSQICVIETYNDYRITYQKVLQHLEKAPETHAVYMANRSVAGCTEAVKAVGKKGKIRVICHDVNESTGLLLKSGSIDFTITQDLFRQGYLPLVFLRELLQKGRRPGSGIHSGISIICSQNLDG